MRAWADKWRGIAYLRFFVSGELGILGQELTQWEEVARMRDRRRSWIRQRGVARLLAILHVDDKAMFWRMGLRSDRLRPISWIYVEVRFPVSLDQRRHVFLYSRTRNPIVVVQRTRFVGRVLRLYVIWRVVGLWRLGRFIFFIA